MGPCTIKIRDCSLSQNNGASSMRGDVSLQTSILKKTSRGTWSFEFPSESIWSESEKRSASKPLDVFAKLLPNRKKSLTSPLANKEFFTEY